MSIASLKDVKARLSSYVDEAIRGNFVTITRHGKPVAVIVPLAAAEAARKSRQSLADYLLAFPGGEFQRNRSPSRDVDL